jgi:AraC-like DNA-binding protein
VPIHPLGRALFAQRAEEPLQRVGALAGVPALLRELGAARAVVLARARLAAGALKDPESRIPYAAMGRLFARGAEATGHAEFGLLAGRLWHLSDIGLAGEVIANSRTVGEALEALTVYQQLNSSGGLTLLMRRGAVVDLGHAVYAPNVEGVDHIYDATLAAGTNYMRELLGSEWSATEVFLPHRAPEDVGPYRNVFRVLPRFDAEFCAMRFSAHLLDRPVARADPVRRREALAAIHRLRPPDFIDVVTRALRRLLLSGSSSGDDLAAMLSMHRRTLNRRLTEEGTTFRAVLDAVRFEVARQLLTYSDLPLDDVAAALGYAGMGPFTHSFHRWTGQAPGAWRREDEVQRMAARAAPAGARAVPRRGTRADRTRQNKRDA